MSNAFVPVDSSSPSIPGALPSRLRIFLADDHAVLREGVKALVDEHSDMVVVGEADSGRAVIQQVRECRPDVVVMDISMPDMDGAQATEAIQQVCPEIKILILTIHQDEGYVRLLLKKGAAGYALKSAVKDELIYAIRHIAGGGIYIDRELSQQIVQNTVQQPAMDIEHESVLSERELEVLRLVAWGHTNKEIAQQLHVGVRSVETYKNRMMEKLGFKNRTQVVRYAVRRGWLQDS